MKTKTLCFLGLASLLFSLPSFSQKIQGIQAESLFPGAKSLIVDEKDQEIKYVKLIQDVSDDKAEQWLNNSLSVSEKEAWVSYQSDEDKFGYTHTRYQHQYAGLPIEDEVYIVHAKNGLVVSANGAYSPSPNVNIPPNWLSMDRAISSAKQSFEGQPTEWYADIVEEPKKVIYASKNSLRAAYKIDLYAMNPLSRRYVYVDAENGQVLGYKDRIHVINKPGKADTRYNGEDRDIITDSTASGYRLRETTRGGGVNTFNMEEGYDYNASSDFIDADNHWEATTNLDDAAWDAHFGAETMYDYFLNTHGRDSYDNQGSPLDSYVHFYHPFYGRNNAFWDGSRMTYMDGDGTNYGPFTAIDVVGHELTHGVTEYSANLVYSYESGALNESFSDIFGVIIDFLVNPNTADYKMGEQISMNGLGLRDMSNPKPYDNPNTYKGEHWEFTDFDNGGVHINSGVQNYWFYLLAEGGSGTNDNGFNYEVNGIGIEKAGEIAYRNLTAYLTPNSDFNEAYLYSVEAATDLFGECSQEVISVIEAWKAVGVLIAPEGEPTASFSTADSIVCRVPATVNFNNNSEGANSFDWTFGNQLGNSNDENPTFTFNQEGTFNVQLIASADVPCSQKDTTTFSVQVFDKNMDVDSIAPALNDISFETQADIFNFAFTADLPEGTFEYMWDFGDGNTSSDPQPVHTYSEAMEYEVNLTVSGCQYSSSMSKNLSVIDLSQNDSEIFIYPNPSNGQLKFIPSEPEKLVKIEVIDASGQSVYLEIPATQLNSYDLNLEGISEGNYFLKIHQNDGTVVEEGLIIFKK